MKIRWQKLVTNFFIWAIAETTLNLVGLDTIADYSEFLSSQEKIEIFTTAIDFLSKS